MGEVPCIRYGRGLSIEQVEVLKVALHHGLKYTAMLDHLGQWCRHPACVRAAREAKEKINVR